MRYVVVQEWLTGFLVFVQDEAARKFTSEETLHTYLASRAARKIHAGERGEGVVCGTYLLPSPVETHIAGK